MENGEQLSLSAKSNKNLKDKIKRQTFTSHAHNDTPYTLLFIEENESELILVKNSMDGSGVSPLSGEF
jgi:hypothetical protein